MTSSYRSIFVVGILLCGCMAFWLLANDAASRRTTPEVIKNNRELQDDNPFAAIGEILIRLIEIILLIFGPGGGGSTPTPAPIPAPTPAPIPAPTPAPIAPTVPGSSFNIRLQYDSSVPSSHIFLFEEAKALFERVITTDITDVPLSELTDTDPVAPGCTYSDVDDIDICVYYTDSVVFGSGGFNNLRFSGPNQPLPITGSIAINSDLAADEFLRDLIVHEMAHALGFGTVDVCPNSPGDAAQAAYESISGCTTPLPVSDDCRHLQESCLTDEMMTPTLWADGLNVFSRITIGWLEDLGYTVNYGPADVFNPSALGTNPSGNCNCNRRLRNEDDSGAKRTKVPALSEEGREKTREMAYQLLGNKSDEKLDGKIRERALAVMVVEEGVPHTVVVRD